VILWPRGLKKRWSRIAKDAQSLHIRLEIITAVFAETLNNFQHFMWLIPKSWSCTLNSGFENPRTRISLLFQKKDKVDNLC
jgi:hypothetical protein